MPEAQSVVIGDRMRRSGAPMGDLPRGRGRMRDVTLFGPPSATLQVLLDDREGHDFPDVPRVVGGLMPAQALTVPPGLPYSIARIVAHMLVNMRFNLGLIRAQDPAAFPVPAELWPAVGADDWPALVDEFLSTLEALKQVATAGGLERVLYPMTGDEPAWTVGYKLACSVAKHNAYHLGQIVVLRRLIGARNESRRPEADQRWDRASLSRGSGNAL